MCSTCTCVDTLNSLWRKFCLWKKQPHVPRSTSRSFSIQRWPIGAEFRCRVSCCVDLQHAPAAPACEECLTTPCTRTQFAWSHFFFMATSPALWPGAGPWSPRSLSPSKLHDETDRCRHPFPRFDHTLGVILDTMEKVFLWPCGPPGEKKTTNKPLALTGLSTAVVLV